jgi:hypothetical protein
MTKTLQRILASISVMIIVTISGLATVLLFPQPLFANKMAHNEFTVYSNQKISRAIIPVLDDESRLVKQSEVYDPDYKYDILLCYNSFFNEFDNKLLGEGASARATDNNVTIKVRVDMEQDLFFPNFRKNCEGSLTTLLAHEMIHCLQANKYGMLKFNPFSHPEMWKLEGYPEYIARQPKLKAEAYSLVHEIDRYLVLNNTAKDGWMSVDEGGCEAPAYYYKGRLMIEYLMDIKHLSYHQILEDETSAEDLFSEMIQWRNNFEE